MHGTLFFLVVVAILSVVESFAPLSSRVIIRSALKAATDDIPITAKMVSTLRAKTDSPMMECKKALIEAKGDFERAEEILRVKLGNKATKVGSRIAAEGLVIAMIEGDNAVLFEANCETDFVSKNPDFMEFTKNVAQLIIKESPADITALSALPMAGSTVEKCRSDLVGKVGENMSIRRFQRFGGGTTKLASYLHGTRIGVIVEYTGSEAAAKDIAMHIAANKPIGMNSADVPKAVIDAERNIAEMKAAESGKPPAIVTKMVEGAIQKYLKEVSMMNQPFVKDATVSVEQYLKNTATEIKSYAFYVVGEGLEKKVDTFVAEIEAARAQVAAAKAAGDSTIFITTDKV
jgi:elongation factor Ts